jgi:hypothetical protein
VDALRPPPPLDHRPEAYRDWLHFNLFDSASGTVGLVNLSLHGAPWDVRARAIGTALMHHPQHGWVGNMEIGDFTRAQLGERSIGLEGIALAIDDQRERVQVSVQLPDDRLSLKCTADLAALPLHVEQQLAFGSGWISWSVLPRMRVQGSGVLAGERVSFASAVGYHDHNWGRWFWGEDIGWDWGTFTDPEHTVTIVFSRATDRDRTQVSPSLVTVDAGGKRRTYTGEDVSFEWQGSFRQRLLRLPGAMAVLHADRMAPNLPSTVVLQGHDDDSRFRLDFRVRACAQLIVADPVQAGTSFVHELIGDFVGELAAGRESQTLSGLGVLEYVY